MDRGDEIISNLLSICEKESIPSAIFSGIGGCQSAELQVFIPETGSFETERLEGMLELVSLNGNVVRDDKGQLFHHTHALFSFKKDGQHGMAGGHLKVSTVLYTAEIELRPTVGVLSEGSSTLRQALDSGILKTNKYEKATAIADIVRCVASYRYEY